MNPSWESSQSEESLAEFKLYYTDQSILMTAVAKQFGITVDTCHNIAQRLGIPSRKGSLRSSAVILKDLDEEESRLKQRLKEIDARRNDLQVFVTRNNDIVMVGGLGEMAFATTRENVVNFVKHGGLGKLKDIAGGGQ